jgi:hypothetical protein
MENNEKYVKNSPDQSKGVFVKIGKKRVKIRRRELERFEV